MIFYFVSMIGWGVVVGYFLESTKRLGLMHAIFLLLSDMVIIYYFSKKKDSIITQYFFKASLMLIIRLIVCFRPESWFAMQSFAFFIVNCIAVGN